MREEIRQPIAPQDREPWIKPVIKHLDAGSAEFEVGSQSDGPNDVS